MQRGHAERRKLTCQACIYISVNQIVQLYWKAQTLYKPSWLSYNADSRDWRRSPRKLFVCLNLDLWTAIYKISGEQAGLIGNSRTITFATRCLG
jgi:hypothetical protein